MYVTISETLPLAASWIGVDYMFFDVKTIIYETLSEIRIAFQNISGLATVWSHCYCDHKVSWYSDPYVGGSESRAAVNCCGFEA